MSANSKIEWTDHTLNFWWGCQKVSPGCEHCYAEAFSKRVGRNIWGPPQTTERWRTKSPWRDCFGWDKQAEAEGVRKRVFCQSMSDFFEDHPQVELWRKEAFEILEGFEWLDVQLLTKRIENVLGMVPAHWLKNWPGHIWIGTTTEDQKRANERIPKLLKIPARVHFLSCEPLLEHIDLGRAYPCGYYCDERVGHVDHPFWSQVNPHVHWVITGGESGHGARPCHPNWVRYLKDQCQVAGVAFFHKQWGQFIHTSQTLPGVHYTEGEKQPEGDHFLKCTDKHWAGRLLDGQYYSEFPEAPKGA